MMQTPPARKATVVTPGQALGLQAADGFGVPPVARPFVGGVASGLHTMPRAGDQVVVLHEKDNHAVGAVSATDTPALLPALLPGETVVLHPSGSYCKFANGGGITLHVSATLQIVLDPSTNRVNITATGGLYVGGVAVTVP